MMNPFVLFIKIIILFGVLVISQWGLLSPVYGQSISVEQDLNRGADVQKRRLFTFAFFPETSKEKMEGRYARLVKLLSKTFNGDLTDKQGRVVSGEFVFETRPNYLSYMEAIDEEKFDIAVVNAFDYVKIKNTTRYIPIVSRSDTLVANIVTSNKKINDLLDLKNKQIGFATQYSSASIAAKYMFLKHEIFSSDYSTYYFNGHIPCLDSVYENNTDVCVTGERIFNKYPNEKKSKLTVIAKGEPLPQLVVLLHPSLAHKQNEIREFFLALQESPQGKIILDETYLVSLENFMGEKYYLCELLLDYISSHEDIN
ncbi:MAG: phosphate/phosphite/phosphonate ABC transporter substrate-binding protein [Cellvibrionaceae bacterium]